MNKSQISTKEGALILIELLHKQKTINQETYEKIIKKFSKQNT